MIASVLALSLLSFVQRPDEQVRAEIEKGLGKDKIKLQVSFQGRTPPR